MGNFKFIPTEIRGVTIVEPASYADERGFFMESFACRDFEAAGLPALFVQDNHSCSCRGVLRGLHFQSTRPQGKLVRVVSGSVLDVAVDIRPGSPTFMKWSSVVLSADNKRQFYIPPGLAHGFLALEDNTNLLYKCTEYYMPQYDAGMAWNDPQVAVDWQLDEWGLSEAELIISGKDRVLPPFSELAK